jgi:hypothetical protein
VSAPTAMGAANMANAKTNAIANLDFMVFPLSR